MSRNLRLFLPPLESSLSQSQFTEKLVEASADKVREKNGTEKYAVNHLDKCFSGKWLRKGKCLTSHDDKNQQFHNAVVFEKCQRLFSCSCSDKAYIAQPLFLTFFVKW